MKESTPRPCFLVETKAGWILKRMRHFISAVKPTPQEKVLLILDGQNSHTQNLAAIEITPKHGVFMLLLLPHNMH
jgi:hypothetical protein